MKSDRVSASIKSKKLKLYIKDTASKKGLSVSAFIEDVLNKKMQEGISIPANISTGMMQTKVKTSDLEGVHLDETRIINQVNGTLSLQFPLSSPYQINMESELEFVNKVSLTKIRNAIKEELTNLDDYHIYKPKSGYGTLENLVIPIFLVEIIKVTVNGIDDKKQIQIINQARDTFEDNIEKQAELTNTFFYEEYKKLNDIMKRVAMGSTATVNVKYRFKFLPLYLNTSFGEVHRYYDFLNIKHQRYNYPKENQTYIPKPFICLMTGKHGYLSCRVFDSPLDIQSYIEKYETLKNEGKTYGDSLIIFLPDPHRFKNNSLLLKKIKSIQDQKRKIRHSLIEGIIKKHHS